MKFYLNLLRNEEFLQILKDGRLTTYFQPLIDLKEKKVYGYECLVRGIKQTGELISPKVLFDTARDMDLLFYLDRSSREMGVKTAAIKGVKEKKIFINFIPTTIYDPEYCLQSTIRWAYQMEYSPSNLVFEVVESYNVKDLNHLKTILDYYRDHGFQTALDDVGSGFSNLNSLVVLQPEFIKVDIELIRGIDQNSLKQSVFKALMQIAKEQGIQVLAEGIETREELQFVLTYGADFAQGYYFAHPSPEPIRELNPSLLQWASTSTAGIS